MKQHGFASLVGAVALLLLVAAGSLKSQSKDVMDDVLFGERNLGGPRLGVTYVMGASKLAETLDKYKIGHTLSQFGWHFEYQVIPDGGGPSFVIQFIPLVAGVEYGKLIPSGTLAMGVRLPEGYEFGLGPNALVTPEGVKSALVMSIGKSFSYGGVNIPINLVYATNPDGNRFSIIFGYAIRKAAR